jgi:hypothetical protein
MVTCTVRCRKVTPDYVLHSEIHTKRQATRHACLPRLLVDGDNGIGIVYAEEKNILYGDD